MLKKILGLLTGGRTDMINTRKIDQNFDVTGQLAPAHMANASALGYRTVICMRPDNEGFNQPAFSDMEAAAKAAGIEAIYFPVIPGSMTPDQARKLKTILSGRNGPVLAYCASGNRCAAAYDMAKRV